MENEERIPDNEFVLLSYLKIDILTKITEYCCVKDTDISIYPDLDGNVFFLIIEESLYRMKVLIRYVNTSKFSDADELEETIMNIENSQYIYPLHMTKNGEELEVVITIKTPEQRKI